MQRSFDVELFLKGFIGAPVLLLYLRVVVEEKNGKTKRYSILYIPA